MNFESLMEGTQEKQIVELLQEQNRLLTELLHIHKVQEKHEAHREWFMIFLKLAPYLIIAALLVWIYLSLSAYLAQLNEQITVIRTNVDGVFGLVSAQFDFLKTMFTKIGDSLSSLVPNFSGMADKVREALPDL